MGHDAHRRDLKGLRVRYGYSPSGFSAGLVSWSLATKFHALGSLNSRNSLPHRSGAGSLRSQHPQDWLLLGTLWENLSQPLPVLCALLVTSGVPWLVGFSLQSPPPSSHGVLRTAVILDQGHPGDFHLITPAMTLFPNKATFRGTGG